MIFAAIADWADSNQYSVEFVRRELGVSRSGFYAWRSRRPSERATTDDGLRAIIKAAYVRLRGNPRGCGGSAPSWSRWGTGCPASACGG